MEDFAAIRINWKPKATNLAEILAGICVLPRNVVFIDDNPAERAAMKLAFPDVRILGRHPYYLRQTLLWSSETQVVSVTGESSQRTDMVKAQLEREARRTELSRADFLMAAAPTVRMIPIDDAAHPRFARAFELINKTNQFNTTGRRWTSEQCHEFFQSGGVFHAFEVTDAYTGYGLVGVVLLLATTITQWVMSCRILGFEIEVAVMGTIVSKLREDGALTIQAHLVDTDVNLPCRDLFAKCGFVQTADAWVLPHGVQVSLPAHVRMEQVSAGRSALP
jgi:FkbH-like protein